MLTKVFKSQRLWASIALAFVACLVLAPVGGAFAATPTGADQFAAQYGTVDLNAHMTGPAYGAAMVPSTPMTVTTIDQATLDALSGALTGSINNIFVYAVMIIGPLMAVAAIGIGFKFGGRLVEWVGDMIGGALH